MKKYILLFLTSIFLASCSNSEDILEYTEVEFSGVDTRGYADYTVDESGLLESLYGVNSENELTQEELDEWENAASDVTIMLDKNQNLSNGDTVVLSAEIPEDSDGLITAGSEKEIEVSDLPQGTVINSEDLKNNINVSFDGLDGDGYVSEISQNFDSNFPNLDFEVENNDELSNGDQAVLTVSSTSINELSQTEYILEEDAHTIEVEVSGLQEPEYIAQEELEKNTVITFTGASGQGTVDTIETTFSSDIPSIQVEVENDGELENGENAVVNITEDTLSNLASAGYAIEEDNQQFEVPVSGLKDYAPSMNDIANIEDVKRLLQEEFDELHEDFKPMLSYEVEFNQYMYRQHDQDAQDDNTGGSTLERGNGNLFGVYSIKEYTYDDLTRDYIVAAGFTDMEVDENQEVNISDLSFELVDSFGDNKSLDTVTQLLEGMGYQVEE